MEGFTGQLRGTAVWTGLTDREMQKSLHRRERPTRENAEGWEEVEEEKEEKWESGSITTRKKAGAGAGNQKGGEGQVGT